MLKERRVILAQRKITNVAIQKRSPAVVNGPNPDRLILIATALAPKTIHRNDVKMATKKGRS